ncbi:phage tail protein [Sphingomonas baiyangensis]|uniref:Phage tail tube protein n=1 Tax=Sphingomonas baiyangensis TaxID=2572576 RepID=A0A4U1L0T7_9SPHN|nr:hypothetical protein [Sphingomonas baiyangensis]TKD50222.1 hypothetical protein FBR43_05225 [Sphingomonas baiyangensis]
MSVPVEPDFAIAKMGDGEDPEVFSIMCALTNVAFNQAANTTDRYRIDCTKPGIPPSRKVFVTGKQWDVTASGVFSVDEIDRFNAALGVRKNYEIEFRQRDGTDMGILLGTYEGAAVMTANNVTVGEEGTAEVTLAGEGEVVWTVAP